MAHAPENGFPEEKPANQRCRHLSAENRCLVFDRLETEGYRVCRAYDCFGAGPMVSTWITADNTIAPSPERLEQFRALSRLRLLASTARDETRHGESPARDIFAALDDVGAAYRRDGVLNIDQETRDTLRASRYWIDEILSRIGG